MRPLRSSWVITQTNGEFKFLACVGSFIFSRNAFFAGGRNIVGAGPLEDFFSSLNFIPIFGVHRDENVSLSDLSLVLLGFIFRNAQSDQGTGKAAHCSTDVIHRKRGKERSSRNTRSNAWDSQEAYADEPSQYAADDRTRAGACRGAFRRLGGFFMGKIPGSAFVGEQN